MKMRTDEDGVEDIDLDVEEDVDVDGDVDTDGIILSVV